MDLMINKESCALITIDTQNDFAFPCSPAEISGTLQVVPKMVELLNKFRQLNAPIIHVIRLYLPDGSNVDVCRRDLIRSGVSIVQPGTHGAELVQELKPASAAKKMDTPSLLQGQIQEIAKNEYLMYKPRWGAFYQTPLESFLRSQNIDSLLFCGCNFPNCPRTSIYQASERDFKVALASDAVSGLYEKGIQELQKIGVSVQETAKFLAFLSE